MEYVKGNTDWMSGSLGISVHWTSHSCPLEGERLPYPDAAARFDVDRFIAQLKSAGAAHLIFTTTHAEHYWAAPNPAVDAVMTGRTSKRDLLGELCESCRANDIRVIFYYNHSCNNDDDPVWKQAIGYTGGPFDGMVKNLCGIVKYAGERYGSMLDGWWFDSCYSMDPRGPENTITTDFGSWRFPWEDFAAAAKCGNPKRVLSFNSGIGHTFQYTTHQDYYAGEVLDLTAEYAFQSAPGTLYPHFWGCVDDRFWVHCRQNTPFAAPIYTDADLAKFIFTHTRAGDAVTLNLEIDQTGMINPESLKQLAGINEN